MTYLDEVTNEAGQVVDDFICKHHAAAIPSLIAACVMWAVHHGGREVVVHSLTNAVALAFELEGEMKASAS